MAQITLRQIAEKLGCTRSTVSYALRNHPQISQATREKIQAVARELGWTPNAELTRQMALVRTTCSDKNAPTLAVIINKPRSSLIEEQAPGQHLSGACDHAAKLGYHVDVFNLAERPISPRRLREVIRARGIEGIIFISTTVPALSDPVLEIGSEFACCIVGMRPSNFGYHFVNSDLIASGRLAIQALVQAGFKRPGAVLPRALDRMLSWGFSCGIHSGQLELPPEQRIAPLSVGEGETHLPAYTFDTIHRWLISEKPDVLLTTDPRYLSQCLEGSAPEFRSLPIYSLDYHSNQPAAGGIDQRQAEAGAMAVDLTISQLHRGEKGAPKVPCSVQLDARWVSLAAQSRQGTPPPLAIAS